MKTISSLVLTAATVISVTPEAKAAPPLATGPRTFAARRHVDVLADRLWKDANQICWEMYRHYGHNHEFEETYREMYRVLQDAQHIHDLVHDGVHQRHQDVDHIASDLHEIDGLFHHIEDDVRNWTSSYRVHDHYGHAVHGRAFSDPLARKLRYFEQTLHHLMADYGVTSRLNEPGRNAVPPAPKLPPGTPPLPRSAGPVIPRR